MIPDSHENIWEHSRNVLDLYRRRARGEMEMDASAQAADILAPIIRAARIPPRLLDAGCGSGYLWHSFYRRGLKVEYYGLDYSPSLIRIGQEELPAFGLPPERLVCQSLENLHGRQFDLALLINTLTFCPDFRQPLDRLASSGAEVMLIRDNFGAETIRRWEIDGYLDPGFNHLKAYWNQWNFSEVADFLKNYGFESSQIVDSRTGGRVELVVGKPYYWAWLLARRAGSL